MSGKTEAGPVKYPTTSDLQSGYFLSLLFFLSFFFLVSQGKSRPLTTYMSGNLQDLLSSDILSSLGKTVGIRP